LVGHRLVEESDRQALQRGVLAGRQYSSTERFPVASPAAPLRGGFHVQVLMKEEPGMATMAKLPTRLHHNAYVTKDQEKTRQCYEEIIGLPLVATWCESDELFGKMRTYVHTFYAIGDGGALAFFQFADPKDQAEFGPEIPASPFHHIALRVDAETQAGLE